MKSDTTNIFCDLIGVADVQYYLSICSSDRFVDLSHGRAINESFTNKIKDSLNQTARTHATGSQTPKFSFR